MRIILCLLCGAMAGCAGSSSEPVRGPNGRMLYRITCHPDIADCLTEAGENCGQVGYHVISQSMHWGGALADLLPGPVPWYNVLAECGRRRHGEAQATVYDPPPPTTVAIPETPTTTETETFAGPAQCFNDYACGFGNTCMKAAGQISGVCAKAVNAYGNQVFTMPDPNSTGFGQRQCWTMANCPIGFQCNAGGQCVR